MKKDKAAKKNILDVNRLSVGFINGGAKKTVLKDISFSLKPGGIHGLVGESGCGKSLFARTLIRLEAPAVVTSGSIQLGGIEMCGKITREIRRQRGKKISLILQDPTTAMDPVFTIGEQLKDVLSAGFGRSKKMKDVYGLMERVGISSPERKCRQYPHEWSRGMLQRAQLVAGLSASPEILILDEITSALDPTIALQIIELILQLRREKGVSFIMITHDLDMAAYSCDHISVMHDGVIVETNTAEKIFNDPEHAYTEMLVSNTGVAE